MAFTERSRGAREAVLRAARRSFADRGYDRTTVRSIAAAAGVDPSMVIRYFGSKQDLFAATLDLETMQVDLRLPDLVAVAPTERGMRLARHFLDLWETEPTSVVLAVLLRSATTNAVAAARVQAVFADQVLAAVRAVGVDGAERRAGTLAAHVLGTALCRYVLGLTPMAAMSREDLAATMGPVLQAILDSDPT